MGWLTLCVISCTHTLSLPFLLPFSPSPSLSPSSLSQFRYKLLIVLAADFVVSYSVDRILSYFLGSGRLKTPPST